MTTGHVTREFFRAGLKVQQFLKLIIITSGTV